MYLFSLMAVVPSSCFAAFKPILGLTAFRITMTEEHTMAFMCAQGRIQASSEDEHDIGQSGSYQLVFADGHRPAAINRNAHRVHIPVMEGANLLFYDALDVSGKRSEPAMAFGCLTARNPHANV